jgi:hypothetical protein
MKQRVVVISYRRFRTTYRSVSDSWTHRMGPISHSETSVINYHYSLRNNPEERSSWPLIELLNDNVVLLYFIQNTTVSLWENGNVCVWCVCVCMCVCVCVCVCLTTLLSRFATVNRFSRLFSRWGLHQPYSHFHQDINSVGGGNIFDAGALLMPFNALS